MIHRDEIHKQLKESYQRLKNDYECEVENHFNDVENILSKSCEQSFSSFTDNCPYLSKFDYHIEKIKLRDGKDNINPYVMKTLCILRVALQLSLRKCIIALVLVGQHMFKQKDWKLSNTTTFAQNVRASRCLTSVSNEIQENSHPSELLVAPTQNDDYSYTAP